MIRAVLDLVVDKPGSGEGDWKRGEPRVVKLLGRCICEILQVGDKDVGRGTVPSCLTELHSLCHRPSKGG